MIGLGGNSGASRLDSVEKHHPHFGGAVWFQLRGLFKKYDREEVVSLGVVGFFSQALAKQSLSARELSEFRQKNPRCYQEPRLRIGLNHFEKQVRRFAELPCGLQLLRVSQ